MVQRRSSEPAGKDYFATTRWTMVLAAGAAAPQAQAMEQLCQIYWVPLYTYLRHKGHQPPEAEDLVQAFFARLIDKTSLAAADPNRGRFRSFLIGSLQHFVANCRDHDRARKRGGHLRKFNLDFGAAEEAYHREPSTGLTPEKIFDRRWAIDLLNLVLSQLRREYVESGKIKLFERLSPCLAGGSQSVGYAQIAAELHISTDAVKMAVSRLRKRYREILRQTIADTVATPDDVEEELQHLFKALAN
jgi:RNA polymerase sigma factor (sigma-70 family)